MLFAPDRLLWRGEIHEGNTLVEKIESFRTEHGRLPTSLSEINTNDKTLEKFFYQKCDENRFIIWFGTTLGESMTFDSVSGSWTPLNITCR